MLSSLGQVDKSKSETRLCWPNLGLHPKKFSLWMTPPRTSSLSGAFFFSGHGDDSSPKQWIEGISPPYEHQSSFAKCFNFSDLFANSSTVVFKKKKMGRKEDLWNSQAVLLFLQASGYMCSTSAGWAFGRSVEPCFKHVQSSSERYQLRNAFPNLRRLSVVGCRLSEKSGLASRRFQRAIFQSACGWTKTHRWRILYLCKIQHPTNQPVLNFPLSHLALPFWAWPKKVSHPVAVARVTVYQWRCVNWPRHRPSWPLIRILIFWKLWWRSWQLWNSEDFYSVHSCMIFWVWQNVPGNWYQNRRGQTRCLWI